MDIGGCFLFSIITIKILYRKRIFKNCPTPKNVGLNENVEVCRIGKSADVFGGGSGRKVGKLQSKGK
jgi:hypothetical protein